MISGTTCFLKFIMYFYITFSENSLTWLSRMQFSLSLLITESNRCKKSCCNGGMRVPMQKQATDSISAPLMHGMQKNGENKISTFISVRCQFQSGRQLIVVILHNGQ